MHIGRRNLMAVTIAIAVWLMAMTMLIVFPSEVNAHYGDDYGIAAINDGAGPAEDAPAIPETNAFWAGACDLGAYVGVDSAIPGGFGSRPSTLVVPNGVVGLATGEPYAVVGAPAGPEQCIDWGVSDIYPPEIVDPKIWQSLPTSYDFGLGPITALAPVGDYAPSWRLAPLTQAGSRPDGTSMFAWNRNTEGLGTQVGMVDGSLDDIVVDLPPGFVGNPQAVPRCTGEEFGAVPLLCPPESQVGVLRLNIQAVTFGGDNLGNSYDTLYPVYNLEPRPGRVAELGFGYASGESAVTVRLIGKPRTNGDYGVTAFTGQIPSALVPIAQSITLWGVPWAHEHDLWRAKLGHFENGPCKAQPGAQGTQYIPPAGISASCQAHYDPSWGGTPNERVIRPFLTNETDCNPAPTVTLATDSFQYPGALTLDGDPDLTDGDWKTYDSTSPAVTGCEDLDFEPDIEFSPTSSAADGASGLDVDLSIPQNNEPPFAPPAPGALQTEIDEYVADATAYWKSDDGLATSHLKDSVVTLPPGVRVNLSGATGLAGCPDGVVGVRGEQGGRLLFNNNDPFDGDASDGECPDGSKIGTVEVDTPLLEEPLLGDVVLGEPQSTDPESGKMLRLFLIVRDEERGLIAKIFGSTTADKETGQLKATFLNNPELPFEDLHLEFKDGSQGVLAMPQRCGQPEWKSTFTSWSSVGAPVEVPSVDDTGAFDVNANCGFGFSPALAAGMDNPNAIANGKLAFQFTRNEGEQWLKGLTAELPPGLLASVRDLPLCTSAQADAGACPQASKIGTVDSSAGSGDPFVIEEKGEVFLTEGYKSGEYGLMVKVRAIGGPFRGPWELTPIVVRQAIHVNRTTAQVTAISDPFPTIWHGVPLGVRRVTVTVDRPSFMRNPSDCSAKEIKATLTSVEGATASPTAPFHATGCASLPFRPKLGMRLTGRRQTKTGKHPGVRAVVTQKSGEAGIKRARVRLPLSLALDPDNAQALCEFADGTKDEPTCPKGSIVGRARATSPLLNDPLVGNVYFVKNVRRDAKTGNLIRTLPMIVVALRGEIAINLRGESSVSKRNQLVNTFAGVPDAPVERFNLNIAGGKNGILVVTRSRRGRTIDICRGKQVAEAQMDGHNGKGHDRRIRMKTPCKKRSKRSARRR
jgi:hypothetical protein